MWGQQCGGLLRSSHFAGGNRRMLCSHKGWSTCCAFGLCHWMGRNLRSFPDIRNAGHTEDQPRLIYPFSLCAGDFMRRIYTFDLFGLHTCTDTTGFFKRQCGGTDFLYNGCGQHCACLTFLLLFIFLSEATKERAEHII